VHAAKRAQERAQCGTRPFAAIAMDLAHTVAIVITCPFVLSVIDRGVRKLQSMITAVLVRIDDRPIARDGFGKNALAGRLVAMPDHPAALLTRLAADDMNDRQAVIVIGSMPRLLIRTAAGWISGVAMGSTFFPPRSDRAHQPRTSCPPSFRLGNYH